MKKATIAATAGIAVTAFAAPTIASASTVVVEAGDTLWGIAQSKGTTVDAIKKANNLTTDKIVPGQKLQVNEVAAAEKTEKSVSATWLNVRSGAGVDNSIITSIKGGTKVTVESTESNGWNKITYNDGETGFVNGKYLTDKVASTPVAPTQEVKKETTIQQAAPAAETKTEVKQTTQATTPAPKVAETKETPVVDQNATTHAVKSGDTIWALSVKYGVSVQDIMSWNNLSSSSIYVGQKLAIKQTANTVTPKAEVKKEAPAAEKQAAPVVKENTNTNTNTTTEKKETTQQQTAPKAPTEAAKPAPAPSTNTNANKTNTNTNSNTNANQGSSNNNSNSSASAIIAEAQKHLGKAYSWGGNGPTTFDCSGYTKYVFAKAGISLPRTSGAQYASTTRISESQAKPGDLVFFDYGSGISHVGIYVGNGQMINAQDNGVKYDNIHGSGWGKYLVGFGRV
ncbi:NlpC/P60 family protein [Listeria monocytogenes]|uniref:NlpC/P60 family protein n=1 Tax=Listeria monocytogenes TaxID=1639 RepID=UPI00098E1AB6|nr:NlpC/P60 family protein [Listeria monocytogenes]EAC4852134.1 LysM peptidoglycan-binding domain-containing protein [Listeria monocytogenes]EAC9284543.1 LysM peptidoglycan-binding domain-containing protein [Listeria monocytogenes]EAC9512252.1 LysM peptidoglycan-binding domain-containing protein [Listeria monocytogenes]EAE9701893.1 LysM peptidoglycan-binding domain-containing protein [Listeria monocytogenes]EAG0149120.1 LysM peptidoglycan-binding domain-containing protein [Listeria monocytogen